MSNQAYVFRSHQPLRAHLQQALATYQEELGQLPPQLTVATQRVAAAEQAVQELNVSAELTVIGLGGCLNNELWLWWPEPEEEHP